MTETPSPMMLQWKACKEEAEGAILLFRLGDFYEAFHEDAETCSRILDLTLTKRQTVPMSGMPVHSAEGYIEKLIAKGFAVAIAEQVEDPKVTKGLVKRAITRVVTPGTLLAGSFLSEKANNYLASIAEVGNCFGIAFLDISTADFKVIEVVGLEESLSEILRFCPKEILTSKRLFDKYPTFFAEIKRELNPLIDQLPDWRFGHELTLGFLNRHLKVHSLDGFGLKGKIAAVNAAGALLSFVQDNLKHNLASIQGIVSYEQGHFLQMDPGARRTLELLDSGSKKHTLADVLDHTKTPMGARLLRKFIAEPLQSIEKIEERQESISEALYKLRETKALREELFPIRDLERLMTKIMSTSVSPKDLAQLKNSLIPIDKLKKLLEGYQKRLLANVFHNLNPLLDLIDLFEKAIVEEPPLRLSDGGVIKEGYNKELDELRTLAKDSKTWMANYQENLRETSGIKTLKVGYTRVFGFYIEISKGQAERAPPEFIRRQTLTTAERFITPELKAFEEKILSAEEKSLSLETEVFNAVREKTIAYSQEVFKNGELIALLDTILSLAYLAEENGYCRPQVHDGEELLIIEGRHPVIETLCFKEKFTPNDTKMGLEAGQMMLITGPNMAGKSTYIRQVALICLMAHMGSFVPATSAKIPLIDKIFTRIGASDDLSRGQSTFMVEMTETANILHHATSRSLVILDEIGRGTSTYDGISLAWAIAEHLLENPEKRPKTLFATHYFELTKLEERVPGAVNYNVAVHESDEGILFLRKIVKGCTDKSYGIHVAKLAGLPASVITRSKEILQHLEESAQQKSVFETSGPPPKRAKREKAVKEGPREVQLTLF